MVFRTTGTKSNFCDSGWFNYILIVLITSNKQQICNPKEYEENSIHDFFSLNRNIE
jgi:hypothetical protein